MLADGSAVPTESKYRSLTGKTNVPDLRGVFLRGKDNLRPGERPRNDDGDSDLGKYQGDAVAAHQHDFKWGFKQDGSIVGGHIQGGDKTSYTVAADPNEKTEVQPNASGETRPRNVTVNYFTRIN